MGRIIVILKPDQEEDLKSLLAKEGLKILEVGNLIPQIWRMSAFLVEGKQYQEIEPWYYLPTYKLVDGELVKCTRPLEVYQLEEMQEKLDNKKKIERQVERLKRENKILLNKKENLEIEILARKKRLANLGLK